MHLSTSNGTARCMLYHVRTKETPPLPPRSSILGWYDASLLLHVPSSSCLLVGSLLVHTQAQNMTGPIILVHRMQGMHGVVHAHTLTHQNLVDSGVHYVDLSSPET